MKKGITICLLALFVLPTSFVEAQHANSIPRIGLLRSGSAKSVASDQQAFLEGLRDHGYVEGKNIMIEYRYADGKADRWPKLASELVALKVDVLVVAGVGVARAARDATKTIPIVVGTAGDLVRPGLVASLAKPGGNLTGSTNLSPDLGGKRLELLKEILPKAARIGVLWHQPAGLSDDDEEMKEVQSAAPQFGVAVLPFGVREAHEFENAYVSMANSKVNAVVVLRSSLTMFNRKRLTELSVNNRLPSLCEGNEFSVDGCLITYGPDLLYSWRRAATFVDKILKGAKPADLPVEQPKKFELMINLKTANQIGVTIPPNVLARANRVIR
jgi:putative ABC transport system substrate-binding protein